MMIAAARNTVVGTSAVAESPLTAAPAYPAAQLNISISFPGSDSELKYEEPDVEAAQEWCVREVEEAPCFRLRTRFQ